MPTVTASAPWRNEYSNRARFRSRVSRDAAARSLQTWVRRRRSARSQSKQISKAFKKISSIREDMRKDDQKYGLYKEFISTALTDKILMLTPAAAAGLTSPIWNNCFANNTNALLANRVTLGPCHMKMQFTCASERSPVTYSIFHVRLNPKNAHMMVSTYGDDLSGVLSAPATPEVYIRGSTPVSLGDASGGASVMLNPDYFIVKKQWRFTIGGYNNTSVITSNTNTFATTKNIDYSFPLGYTLGKGLGSWGNIPADKDTDAHLRNYLLIFSDNIGTDLQYNQYNIVAQCTARYK